MLFVANNVFKGNSGAGSAPGGIAAAASGILVVSNNIFANNTGGVANYTIYAGAASFSGSSILVTANIFQQNSSGNTVQCSSSGVINGNIFTGNKPQSYGAGTGSTLYCGASSTTAFGNTFSGNSADTCGGIYFAATGVATNNTFVGNSSTTGGGAVYLASGGVIAGNTFRQNSAAQGGGAVYATGSSVTLVDNLLVKNSQTGASYQGGGVYASPSSSLTLVNNTLSDNTSGGSGGGLAIVISGTSQTLNVYNNVIWGNSASGNGSDVYLAGTGSKKSFINNDVSSMYGVWDITANLIDAAPAFFDPVNGDYHLRSTSACINAGTNGAPSIPAFDLDGNNRTNAAIVDLGCYEFNNTLFHPADVDQSWTLTPAEYINYAAAWKTSQTWPTGPAQISADYVTRAGYIQNVSTNYHNDGAGAPLGWKPGL